VVGHRQLELLVRLLPEAEVVVEQLLLFLAHLLAILVVEVAARVVLLDPVVLGEQAVVEMVHVIQMDLLEALILAAEVVVAVDLPPILMVQQVVPV
jgi:hypothetical protein